MDIFIVIALIALGISLIVIEIIFVPGTTIVGIAGFLFGGYGIYLSYETFGQNIGIATTVISVSIAMVIIIYTLKNRAWERFSLKQSSSSRVNDENENELQVGEQGRTISALKPYGKAIFNEKIIEVKSNDGYIAEKSEIQIIKIDNKQIIVKNK